MRSIFREFERKLLKRSRFFGPQTPDNSGLAPVTIITGGSEGIGRSLALACAELELDLLLIARDIQNLEETKRAIEDAHSVTVHLLRADLSDATSASLVADTLKDKGLYPHLLINNVGIGLCGPFTHHTNKDIQHLINVNVSSWTALTRQLLPLMLSRKTGGIINISSLAGMVPGPYQAVYYASKAYMNSLSQALSQELAFTGIRVAAVAPGPVATDFHAKMGAERSVYLFVQNVLSPDTVARASLIWFAVGRRMIVPGILNSINSIFVRIVPHAILLGIMGVLLKRRSKVGKKDETG